MTNNAPTKTGTYVVSYKRAASSKIMKGVAVVKNKQVVVFGPRGYVGPSYDSTRGRIREPIIVTHKKVS